jgi:hypothetical protein
VSGAALLAVLGESKENDGGWTSIEGDLFRRLGYDCRQLNLEKSVEDSSEPAGSVNPFNPIKLFTHSQKPGSSLASIPDFVVGSHPTY